eukprot:scaffold492_cov247-Chaetoceros_neogracile.AAC.10
MIRSSRIPPLLNRICTDGIVSSYIITIDGELLGCSNAHTTTVPSTNNASILPPSSMEDNTNESWEDMDPSDISALVAEVVDDYKRLGLELALLNIQGAPNSDTLPDISSKGSNTGENGEKDKDKERGRLNCLIIEMERGLMGIATATSNTYVVALTDSTAQHGYLKMKLISLAGYVRDAFSPLDAGSL